MILALIKLSHVPLTWHNNEHRILSYVNAPFNDSDAVQTWESNGYAGMQFTGDMYDMQQPWPDWCNIEPLSSFLGWRALSWSFYRMSTCTVLPEHADTYKRFKELNWQAQAPNATIHRAIVFLEDWQPGHVLTLNGQQVPQWEAGNMVEWTDDELHLAANIGLAGRYTLQLTGFTIDED